MDKVIVEPASDETRAQLVARYKLILKEYIDRRPSGTRLKIANALNKNKSFISQITNPNYAVPVPARHLNKIFSICHFSVREREAFLEAYTAAHPNYQYRIESDRPRSTSQKRQLVIDVPILANRERQRKVEQMVRTYAKQLFALLLEED